MQNQDEELNLKQRNFHSDIIIKDNTLDQSCCKRNHQKWKNLFGAATIIFIYYLSYILNFSESETIVVTDFNDQQLIEEQQQFAIKFDQQNKINESFFLQNQIPRLIAGQIHYSRIPYQYWQHRILTIKSMGFNSLSIYVMWNFHQIRKGVFDFKTQNKNLKKFLSLAQKHNMKVLLRPGPYVCAQWDWGGLPARLLSIKGLKIRSNNNLFLREVTIYFKALSQEIKPYWSQKGGTIVLMQIQNEYGFYGRDKNYIENLRKIWISLGVKIPHYYVEWKENIQDLYWDGANLGLNGVSSEHQFNIIQNFKTKQGIIMAGEVYSGWMTHWRQNKNEYNIQKFIRSFKYLLGTNYSFSMYMVHGGTNFGLTAGANAGAANKWFDYTPHITSYDYEAPLNQQGLPTQKYYEFRKIALDLGIVISQPPAPITAIYVSPFEMKKKSSLFANLKPPQIINRKNRIVFESSALQMFNQGIALYSCWLRQGAYEFKIIIHDFGIVYLDNVYVGLIDRTSSSIKIMQIQCQSQKCRFQILIEAMGHINFGHEMETDFKGLLSITDTIGTQFEWNITKIPIDEQIINWNILQTQKLSPVVYQGEFIINDLGDTFLNLKKFKKGYIWVNGRNLGRYWNVGPQDKLYCPGVWLKSKQKNIVHILQLNQFDDEAGKTKIIWGQLTGK